MLLPSPSQVCKGPPQHEEICLGLFTLVLTEPTQAQKVRPVTCSSGAAVFAAFHFPGGHFSDLPW